MQISCYVELISLGFTNELQKKLGEIFCSSSNNSDAVRHRQCRGHQERRQSIIQQRQIPRCCRSKALYSTLPVSNSYQKYTEAITIYPTWTVAIVNRANCFKRLGRWTDVERDCRKALEIDNQTMKVWSILTHSISLFF